MSASELKRCPFCGGTVKLETGLYIPIDFRCISCGMVMRPNIDVSSEKDAIAAWNRRAGEGES